MKMRQLPVTTALRLIPDALHTRLFCAALNHGARGQSVREQLAALDGKTFCLAVTDANLELRVEVAGTRLYPYTGRDWDVRLRGRLADFWQLATRAEDPDTLFFHRRLCLEGNTETALYLKNLLDALEFDGAAHVQDVLGPTVGRPVWRFMQASGLERRFRRLASDLSRLSSS